MALLGRAPELRRMETLVDAAEMGRSGVIVVEGPPGLGKSSLLAWLRDDAAARGDRRWSSVLVEVEELDALRPLGPLQRIAEVPPADASTVGAVIDWAERMSTTGPTLLAFDDVHWAHPDTLEAAGAIATRLSDLPILLAVALRPAPRSPELGDLLELLDVRGASWLELQPLPEDVVQRWVRSEGSTLADAETIVARAGGNPLLVEELLRQGDQLSAPLGHAEAELLQRAVLRRMLAFDDDTLDLVRAACILGRQSIVADLSALTGLPAIQLVRALERASAQGILHTSGDRVVFRHDVVREAVYADLSEGSRAALHLEAARRLSDTGAGAAAVAPHLVRAAGSRDPDALNLLIKTAWTLQSTDRAVAVPLFERALELTDPRSADHLRLRAGLVTPLAAASRQSEAIALAREVLQEDLPEDLAEQVRGSMLRAMHRTGSLHDAIREGERLAASTAGAERRRIEADIAYQKLLTGDVDGGAALARRVLDEAVGEEATVAAALVASSTGALAKGEVAEGLSLAQRAGDLMRTTTSYHRGVAAGIDLVTVGLALLHADETGAAMAAAERGLRRELSESDAAGTPPYHFLLGFGSLTEGRWDNAWVALATGFAVIESGGNPLGSLLGHAMAAVLAWGREGTEAAAATLARGHADIAANGVGFGADHLFYVQAIIDHEAGRTAEAASTLDATWQLGSPVRYLLPWTYILPEVARIAVESERVELAYDVLAEARRAAERAGTTSTEAAVLRIRGHVDGDHEAIRRAADLLARHDRRFELARCSHEMAAMWHRDGRPDAATVARRAAELYRSMGADWLAEQVHHQVLNGPEPRRQRPIAGWHSLTDAELKVARSLAGGGTKADTAAALFLSPHTVDSHLRSIYRKLEIRSRAELATVAAAHQE